MKFSCSTFYISHPVQIKHGQLQRTKEQDQSVIDYFTKIKEEQSDIDSSIPWKTNWWTHVDHQDVLSDC